MREFVEITKAAGKVIEGVEMCFAAGIECLIVTYTDDTYSFVHNQMGAGNGIRIGRMRLIDLPRQGVIKTGVATAQEYDLAVDAEKKRRQGDAEAAEFAEYLRLKAKFEGKE